MVEYETKNSFEAAIKAGMEPSRLAAEVEKLDRPLRIAVLGVDCRAIAKLVNLMLAERMLPVEDGQHAAVRLRFAPHNSLQTRDESGETLRHEFEELPRLIKESVSLTIGAPLEALKKVVVFCQAAKDADALQSAAARSVPFSDLTFLCSESFGEEEAAFWANLPESVRDRGYQFLPLNADATSKARRSVDNIIKIDTDAAMEARETDAGLDRTAFTESGGMQLISAIRQELKWHEKGIEEAKVALMHGVLDVRNLGAEAAPFLTDGQAQQDSGSVADTASRTASSKQDVAEAQVEQINDVSHAAEDAELDADFDTGDFWSKEEDTIEWRPEEASNGSRKTSVSNANHEVPE